MRELTAQYRLSGLNPERGKRAKDELIEKGFVVEERVSISNSYRIFLVLTRRRYRAAGECHEFWRKFMHSNESFTHIYYKHFIAWLFSKHGYKAEFEAGDGRGRIDVVLTKGREKIAVEIELSPRYSAENFRKVLGQKKSGFSKFIVICPNNDVLAGVKNAVEGVAGNLEDGKLVLVTLGQLIRELGEMENDAKDLLRKE